MECSNYLTTRLCEPKADDSIRAMRLKFTRSTIHLEYYFQIIYLEIKKNTKNEVRKAKYNKDELRVNDGLRGHSNMVILILTQESLIRYTIYKIF